MPKPFIEQNEQHVLANHAMLAIKRLQDDFTGFVEENNLQNADDVVALVKEIRAERTQSLIKDEKRQATVKLLAELTKGIESVRKNGSLSVDEAFAELGSPSEE